MTETKIQEKSAEKAEKTTETTPKAKTTTKTASKTAAKKTPKDEIMQKYLHMIQFVQNMVNGIETDLKRMNIVLNQLTKFDPEKPESFESIEKETKEIIGENDLKNYTEENMEIVE